MSLRVGWHLAIRALPIGITQECLMKPPDLDLPKGHLILPGPIERYLSLLAHTMHGDPGST
jgi:hypothetical protein